MKRSLTREQLTAIISGILCIVSFLVVMQLWLLTTTMNAHLGDDASVTVPAAVASLLCCALNVVLFRYLRGLERPRSQEAGA